MHEHLIVAIDGNETSSAALDRAMMRTDDARDEIEIISVIDPDASLSVEHARRSTLDEAAARLGSQVSATIVTTLRRGEVESELVRASQRADLLIVGSDAREHGWAVNQSSLPLRLASRSECVLVVVPRGHEAGAGPVVVGSEAAGQPEPALDFAVAEALRLQRPLVIAHGWEISAGATAPGFADGFEVLAETARDMLENVVQATRVQHPDLQTSGALIQAPLVGGLVNASRHAALLVVGNRGRGALASIVLGSVSRDVLALLPCPVAVVPNTADRHGAAPSGPSTLPAATDRG